MPKVELSQDTYNRLLKRARSFEDTPEDVVRRLLEGEGRDKSHDAGKTDLPTAKARAKPGSILPEKEYWCPILAELDARGGKASASEVIDALGARMSDQLTAADREELRMGEVRWRNRARFARLKMRERGLLSNKSHRGVWELTDDGRRYLAECADGGENGGI